MGSLKTDWICQSQFETNPWMDLDLQIRICALFLRNCTAYSTKDSWRFMRICEIHKKQVDSLEQGFPTFSHLRTTKWSKRVFGTTWYFLTYLFQRTRHLCVPLVVRVPQVGNRCFRALAGFVILYSKRLFLSQDFWSTIQTESGFVVHKPKQTLKS